MPHIISETEYNSGCKCLKTVMEALFAHGFHDVKVDGPTSYTNCISLGCLAQLVFPNSDALIDFMQQFPLDVTFPDLPFRYFLSGGTRGKPTILFIMTK